MWWLLLVLIASSSNGAVVDTFTCSFDQFVCGDGSCISNSLVCDGISQCDDKSDEAACDRPIPSPGRCMLPPYSDHGSYNVTDIPNARPGDSFFNFVLNLTCQTGYNLDGHSKIYCINGHWSVPVEQFPKCIRYCTLRDEPSVVYSCLLSGDSEGTRPCQPQEPSGTVVNVECNAPNYYTNKPLPQMQCIDGNWDSSPTCMPECGRIQSNVDILITNGVAAKPGELPWHVGIYDKSSGSHKQICGGSLLSPTVIISAAQCFWSETDQLLPYENYAVAVGKVYRPWDTKYDKHAQQSDVSAIHVSPRYAGQRKNYQADLAIVIASTPFEFDVHVRPVCLDFDRNFDEMQLHDGAMGKFAGWGLPHGRAAKVLKVTELPFINSEQCMALSTPEFIEYFTIDKFCAGYMENNKNAVCKGESGEGLAIPDVQRNIVRYYLRGIASTGPINDNKCVAFSTFTHVLPHEKFISSFL